MGEQVQLFLNKPEQLTALTFTHLQTPLKVFVF